jgi:hypothetical protein
MGYADMGALAADPAFVGRVTACAVEQAKVIADDAGADPADKDFALRVVGSPAVGGERLVPLLAVEPSFADLFGESGEAAISDGMVLAAIQANWHLAATALVLPMPPPRP